MATRMLEKMLFSIEEAAELLGIGRSTAYDLVKGGELPSVKIGRRRLVPREALHTWIRKKTEGGVPLGDFEG